MSKRIIFPLTIFFLSLWWGWTVLIDFIVIPAVFRTIKDFFSAGELGILLFSKLNVLEVIISSNLVAMLACATKKNKKALPLLIMVLMTWSLVMLYFTWLTPKIDELTILWQKADAARTITIVGIADIQQEHQFYHKLYIKLDTLKLLLLTAMISYGIVKEEKWT